MKRRARAYRTRRVTKKRRRYGRFRATKKSFRSAKRQSRVLVKRTQYTGTWVSGSAATNDFWRYFTYTPANINNFGEFQNVFDEYKINAIKITFRPRYDNLSPSDIATQNVAMPVAHFVIDPESTTLPSGTYTSSNFNSFLEQSNVKARRLNRPFSVYFRPKVDIAVNGGGTAVKSIKPGYMKTNDTGVTYKGFHMFIQNFGMSNTMLFPQLDIYATFYMTFRNLK